MRAAHPAHSLTRPPLTPPRRFCHVPGEAYTHASDDDLGYGVLPSYSSYASETPSSAAPVATPPPPYADAAEHSLGLARPRLCRLLADASAAATPSAAPRLLEALGELAAAAASAALSAEARLHLATLLHAAAAAVLPPFACEEEAAPPTPASYGPIDDDDDEAAPSPHALHQIASLALKTIELASAAAAQQHDSAAAGLRAARRSLASLVLLATQVEPPPAAAAAALHLARSRLAAAAAAATAPAVEAELQAVAGSAPLQEALARLYPAGGDEEVAITNIAAAPSASAAAAAAAESDTEDEDDEDAAMGAALRAISGAAAAPPQAVDSSTGPTSRARRLRQTVSHARAQVGSALRSAGGGARLAAACTALLLPLDLRALVLSQPPPALITHLAAAAGGGDADTTEDEEEEEALQQRDRAADTALGLCSGLLELQLALDKSTSPSATPTPTALPEQLRALRALLCSFCLSANLPTGASSAHALGGLVSRRLSAVSALGLLPAALRLVRREAAAAKHVHAAPNARLCAAAALSWALGAAVPLAALFDPAGALGNGWPPSAAAGAGEGAAAAEAAWRRLRAAQPKPVDASAVDLLLRCAASLLAPPPDSSEVEACPATAPVFFRLAGGFLLAAEGAHTHAKRLEALFALPGSTLLDSLLGLTLASSLRPIAPTGAAAHPAPATASAALLRVLRDSDDDDEDEPESAPPPPDVQLRLLRFLTLDVLGPSTPPGLAPLLRRSLATRHVRVLTLLLQFGAAKEERAEARAALRLLAAQLAPAMCERVQAATLRAALVDTSPLLLHPELLRFYARVATLRLGAARDGADKSDDPLAVDVLRAAVNALRTASTSAASPLPLPHAQLLLLLWHALSPPARAALFSVLAAAVAAAATGADQVEGWRAPTLRLVQMLDYCHTYPSRVPQHLPQQLHAYLSDAPSSAALVAFDPATCLLVRGDAAASSVGLLGADLYDLRAQLGNRRTPNTGALDLSLDEPTKAALHCLLALAHRRGANAAPSHRQGMGHASADAAAAHDCHIYHTAWRLLGSSSASSTSPPETELSGGAAGRGVDAARRSFSSSDAAHSSAWLACAAAAMRHSASDPAALAQAAVLASAHALAAEQALLRTSDAASIAAALLPSLRAATAAAAAALAAHARAAAAPAGCTPQLEALLRAGAASDEGSVHAAVASLGGGAIAGRAALAPGQPTRALLRWLAAEEEESGSSDVPGDASTSAPAEARLLRLLTAHLLAPEAARSAAEEEEEADATPPPSGRGTGPASDEDDVAMTEEDEGPDAWAWAAGRAEAARRAAAAAGALERSTALSRLQLAMHALLRACAACASAVGAGSAGELLQFGTELVGLVHEAWFGFCAPALAAAAAAALPHAPARAAWADLSQLARLHAAAGSGGAASPRPALRLTLAKLEALLASSKASHALLYYRGVRSDALPAAAAVRFATFGATEEELGAPGDLARLICAAPAGDALDVRVLDAALQLLRRDDEEGHEAEESGKASSSAAASSGGWPLPPRDASLARGLTCSLLALGGARLEAWLASRLAAAAEPSAPGTASSAASSSSAASPPVATAGRDAWARLCQLLALLLVGPTDGSTDHAAAQAALCDSLWPVLRSHLEAACCPTLALPAPASSSSPSGDAAAALSAPDAAWVAWGADMLQLLRAMASRPAAEEAGASSAEGGGVEGGALVTPEGGALEVKAPKGGRLEELVRVSLSLLDRMRAQADVSTDASTDQSMDAATGPSTSTPTDAATEVSTAPMETEASLVCLPAGPAPPPPPLGAACALLNLLGDALALCDPPQGALPSQPLAGAAEEEMGDAFFSCSDADDHPSPTPPRAATSSGVTATGTSTCGSVDESDADVLPAGESGRAAERRERQLACRVCSFALTGSNFTEQHWYYCYTCGLTQSEGCCSVCIRVCHKGHVVSYSRKSRFFCDCGAGGLASRDIHCAALAPRRYTAPTQQSAVAAALPTLSAARRALRSGRLPPTNPASSSRKPPSAPAPSPPSAPPPLAFRLAPLSPARQLSLLQTLAEASVVRVVFGAYRWLLALAHAAERAAARTSAAAAAAEALPDLFPPGAGPKPVLPAADLAAVRAALRPGSFDVKPRAESPLARETRTLLATGALQRQLLAAAGGLVAVAEGDRLHVCDAAAALAAAPPPTGAHSHRHHPSSAVRGAAAASEAAAAAAAAASGPAAAAAAAAAASHGVLGLGTPLERSSLRPLSRTALGFEATSLSFCPDDAYEPSDPASPTATLLVAGLRSCVALGIGARGEVLSRVTIDLGLDPNGGPVPALLRASWLPPADPTASTLRTALLTSQWVKVVDLAAERSAPPLHFTLADDDTIKDVTFAGDVMLIMGGSGTIYTHPLAAGSAALTQRLAVPPQLHSRLGSTLHFSPPTALLFTSYADGRAYALRLNAAATDAPAGFPLHPVPGASAPAASSASGPGAACAYPSLFAGGPGASSAAAAAPASARSVPHSHWADVPGQRGLLVAACRKTLQPLLLCVTPTAVDVQPLRPSGRAEGLLAVRAPPAASAQRASSTSAATPALVWSLHDDGSLVCHQATRAPLGAAAARADALRAALHAAFARRTVAGTRLRFPVDALERGACVTAAAELTLASDAPGGGSASAASSAAMRAAAAAAAVAGPGAVAVAPGGASDSDRLKARLSAASDDHLAAAPSHGGGSLTLTITNASASLVPVGVRVLVGATHVDQVPIHIRVFKRSVPTAPNERRWYDIPFTQAESVAGQRAFTVTLTDSHRAAGSGAERGGPPVINAFEVFGLSRDEFEWDAVTEALEAKHLPPAASSGGAASSTDGGAPAELLSGLERALTQLRAFHAAAAATGPRQAGESEASSVGAAAPMREEMLSFLPRALLLDGPRLAMLKRPTKGMLRMLEPRVGRYHELKDGAVLRHALAAVGQQQNGSELSALLPGLCKLARKRPQSLLQFAESQPTFLRLLCQSAPSSSSSGKQALRHLYQSLVHILLACACEVARPTASEEPLPAPTPATLDALRPAFDQLAALLLSPCADVRAVVSAALARALLAPPTAPPTAAAPPAAAAPTVAAPAVTGGLAAAASHRRSISAAAAALQAALAGLPPELRGAALGGGMYAEEALEEEEAMEVDEGEEEDEGEEMGEEEDEEEGLVVEVANGMEEMGDEMGEEGEEEAMDLDGGEDDGEEGDGGDEDAAMLAVAMAMSLQQARRDGVQIEGEAPPAAAPPPTAATAASSAAAAAAAAAETAAAAAAARSARRRQRCLVLCARQLLLEGLPGLQTLPGAQTLPYLQLLLQLTAGGAAEAPAAVASAAATSSTAAIVATPSSSTTTTSTTITAITTATPADESRQAGAWGCAVADAVSPLLLAPDTLNVSHRSVTLEQQVLLLLYLCLSLHRDKRSAQAGAEPVADAPDTALSTNATQAALVSRLAAHGSPALLLSLSQRLFAHFSDKQPSDADVADAPPAAPSRRAANPASAATPPAHRAAPPLPNAAAAPVPSSASSAARALAPFFSEAYAKAHAEDLFDESQQLLLDAALRLAQRLAQRNQLLPRSEALESTTEYGAWASLLCRIIHTPALNFARKQAKKLLLVLCGNKPKYAETKDGGLAALEIGRVGRVLAAVEPSTDEELPPPPLEYEAQLELAASLQRILDSANAQPDNWARFCARGGAAVPAWGAAAGAVEAGGHAALALLLRAASTLRGDASLRTLLKLLVLALPDPTATLAPRIDVERLLASFSLPRFVRQLVLGAARAPLRAEACAVVRGLWAHAVTPADRNHVFFAVRAQLSPLPLHGAAAHELLGFLGDVLTAADAPPPGEVLDLLVTSLKAQNALLLAHPNAATYAALGGLLELEAHHLETAPCLAAGRPEAPPTTVRLESLRAETKFTESCQIVALSGSHALHGGTLRITDARRSMSVATVKLYCNNKPVGDLGELKNQWGRWKKVKTLTVPLGQPEVKFSFAVPVVATNLLIEYAAFHETGAAAGKNK